MSAIVRFVRLEEIIALFVRDLCSACSKKKKCPHVEDRTACEFFLKNRTPGQRRGTPAGGDAWRKVASKPPESGVVASGFRGCLRG